VNFRTAGNKEAKGQANMFHGIANDPDDVALDVVSINFVESVDNNQSRIRLEPKGDDFKEASHRRNLLDGFNNEDLHLFFSSPREKKGVCVNGLVDVLLCGWEGLHELNGQCRNDTVAVAAVGEPIRGEEGSDYASILPAEIREREEESRFPSANASMQPHHGGRVGFTSLPGIQLVAKLHSSFCHASRLIDSSIRIGKSGRRGPFKKEIFA